MLAHSPGEEVPRRTDLFLPGFSQQEMRLFLPSSLPSPYPCLLPSTAFPNCCLLGWQLG